MLLDLARTVVAALGAAAIVGIPVLALALVVARVTRRRTPAWLLGAIATLLGVLLGYLLLASETDPALRVGTILGLALVVGFAFVTGRLTTAGFVLIAASLPWTLFAGAYLLDGVGAPVRRGSGAVVPPFVAGVVGIVVGIALIRFHRQYLARHPSVPDPVADEALRPRAWNAASAALIGPSVLGLTIPGAASVVALVIGAQASVVVAHGRPILETLLVVGAGSVATGLAAALAWAFVWPGRRRAFEAFAWLGEVEFDRFRSLTDGRMAPTLDNMKRYVRNNAERPDDRWLRTEILAATGQLDAAREMAERIPDDTPMGRMEQANYRAYIDWLAGGPGDLTDLRAAIAAIEPPDGDDHLQAEVALALAEVRLRFSSGADDVTRPMREVRDRIGARANGVQLAAARRIAPGYLRAAFLFVGLITLLDRVFSV